ncbi:hypothetical protein GCM10009682_35330 [Luedemannella flava]|uniref:Uncharacterized protein n=1 Tax=Luedemannella flava TaxID=349316 RepID=A0ABN2M5Y4_9ACTN
MNQSLTLDLQLNVDVSRRDPGELAYHWIDDVSQLLAGDARQQLAHLPGEVQQSARPFGPLGDAGSVFGVVDTWRKTERGIDTTEMNCSTLGLQWLRSELDDLPYETHLWIGNLDEHGHRSGRIANLSVRHVETTPNWLRLHAFVDESVFLDRLSGPQAQRQYLDALWSFANQTDPGFGHVAYWYSDGVTALEDALPRRTYPRQHSGPDFTVNECRQWLRGYSWLTIVPQDLADQVGGADGLSRSGAFVEVRPMDAGGVWLLATHDYRDYSDEAVERVWRTLAPILRQGLPEVHPPRFPGTPPHRIVARDAVEIM